MIKQCLVCKKKFETGGRSGDVNKAYCSIECSNRARVRHGSIVNSLTIEDVAYLAGLIDGEGSFILYMRRDVVACRITIAGTKRAVLDWVINITGVGCIVDHVGNNPNHAKSYWYQLNSSTSAELAQQLIPYLKIKQEQAKLLVKTVKRLQDPQLKADRIWQKEYHEQMKRLNKRGAATSSDGG